MLLSILCGIYPNNYGYPDFHLDFNSKCILERGVNYQGNNIFSTPVNVNTAKECNEECLLHERCTHWSWYNSMAQIKNKFKCYIKTSDGGRKAYGSTDSGSRGCAENGKFT